MTERTLPAISRTIVLVGLMGAGKSCIGARLAERLDVAFFDADAEIEEAAGCSVADIFEIYGEDEFRAGERRVIERLLNGPVHVLATGGGAFMDPETRSRIRARGTTIWLRADRDLLLARLGRRNNRPLLNNGNRGEIIERLIEERYPVYAEADIVVDSVREPPDVTVTRVLGALQDHLDGAASGEAAP